MTPLSLHLLLLLVPFSGLAAILMGSPARRTGLVASLMNLALVSVQFVAPTPLDHFTTVLLLVMALLGYVGFATIPGDLFQPGALACCLLLLEGAGTGVCTSLSSPELLFFLSLTVLTPFFMIGKWGGHNRQLAAFQTTFTWAISLGLISAGVIGAQADTELPYCLLGLGFALLMGVIPGHGWILAGYSAAPTSASIMMGGVIPCLALYGLNRWPLTVHLSGIYLAFGLINLLYAGLLSGEMREVKQIIGAALISQRGLIFLGLGAQTHLGWQGAALLTLGGALSGGCLLGLAGELEARTGENRVRELSRLAEKLPNLAFLTLLATLVVSGCPFSLTFIGSLLILVTTVQIHAPLIVLGVITGMALSTSGLLRFVRLIFFEPPSSAAIATLSSRPVPDLVSMREIFPYGLLLLVNLILGCNPNWILARL